MTQYGRRVIRAQKNSDSLCGVRIYSDRMRQRQFDGVKHNALDWASGKIQKTSTSFLCRKKVAEPSGRRLWDCYAKQFFHQNAPACHSGVFAFVI